MSYPLKSEIVLIGINFCKKYKTQTGGVNSKSLVHLSYPPMFFYPYYIHGYNL